MSVVISCECLVFLGAAQKVILTRLNALQYTKVMVVLTYFCGTVCTILLSSAIFAGTGGALKAQMPVVSTTTGICRVLCCLLRCEDFAHQVCSLGGGLTDLHACCFQSFLLRLSGTGGTGDNSACVAHGQTAVLRNTRGIHKPPQYKLLSIT